jgi:isopentenyl-diphosphate delta-isomerase type 1
MDQHAMMETDRLIAVDENDRVVSGSESAASLPGGRDSTTDGSAFVVTKRDGHRFDGSSTPRGILHRAFSVFVFDPFGRLLLTQRAATKITFPNVWTNACCSHPLHGMIPDEVDDDNNTEGEVRTEGIKNAAVRKLQHELGISPHSIDKDRLVFVKRFHYWASDTITYGNEAPWGEHEVDYVFFYQAPINADEGAGAVDEPTTATAAATGTAKVHDDDRAPATTTLPLSIRPNPEEVAAYEFVTKGELMRRMRKSKAGESDDEVLWSPWFVGIMERGGFDWWDNLEHTLRGKYTSNEITYFDPPARHVAAYNLPHHGRTTGVAGVANRTEPSPAK